jgi:hypothetical protein
MTASSFCVATHSRTHQLLYFINECLWSLSCMALCSFAATAPLHLLRVCFCLLQPEKAALKPEMKVAQSYDTKTAVKVS